MALLVGQLKAMLDLDTKGFDKGLDQSEAKFRGHAKKLGAASKDVAKQAGSGLGAAERSSFRLQGTLGKLGGVAGRASIGLGGIAKGAGIAGVAISATAGAVIGAGIKVTDYAGRLELLKKKSATVFGGEIGRVQTWAKANAHAMGLTKGEATGLAAGMADLLIPMGFTRKAAADMSTQTVGLSGALAEWSGGTKTAAEVTEILSAAFMGERDGLNALGISITQAEVDARLLANGQDKLTGKQLQQAEATATQALIMEKSVDAQKAYADGAGSLARNSAESRARLKEMGETLATKATPMLLKIGTAVNEHVLPAMERFGGWLNDNRFTIALVFIGIGRAVLGLAKVFGPAMKFMTMHFLDFVGAILTAAAKVDNALGGKLGLQKVADGFEQFRQGAEKAFDGAISKAREWDSALSKTEKELRLKANIQDLESKLKTAKAQLADKSLTKERRAQIVATIKDLQSKLQTAHVALDAKWITKQRVARLEANKKDLDVKLASAKRQLADPNLTKVRRAKLDADKRALERKLREAQAAINALKGKTVLVRYSAAGVTTWTAASTRGGGRVGMKAGGAVHGPGGPTDDRAGLFALSDDEHVWTAKEVAAAGGHGAVERMRNWVLSRGRGLAAGGPANVNLMKQGVFPSVKEGNAYLDRMFGGGGTWMGGGGLGRQTFRGKTLNGRTIQMLLAAERILGAVFRITQGSWSTSVAASGGTHAGGGVMDTNDAGVGSARAQAALRRVGFAAWWRLASQGPWRPHMHSVALGDPTASPSAKRQMASFRAGRSGLGYRLGTPWVPEDQLALVHRGEGIIPAEENRRRLAGEGALDLSERSLQKLAQILSTMSITLDGRRVDEGLTRAAMRSY